MKWLMVPLRLNWQQEGNKENILLRFIFPSCSLNKSKAGKPSFQTTQWQQKMVQTSKIPAWNRENNAQQSNSTQFYFHPCKTTAVFWITWRTLGFSPRKKPWFMYHHITAECPAQMRAARPRQLGVDGCASWAHCWHMGTVACVFRVRSLTASEVCSSPSPRPPLLVLPRWGCPGPCTACPAQPGLGLGLGAGSTVRTTATRGESRNGTRLLFATPGTLKYEKCCPCAFCHFGQGGKTHSAFQWKLFQRIWHAVFLKGSQNRANPLISTLV